MTSNSPRIDRVEGELMPVNSYLVHGPDGLVVVDGQLTVSDADKVRRAIDATNSPVAALVVTHPHPDHYAGAARMLMGINAPIVATAAVEAAIRHDDAEKDTIVGPMMGADWPAERRFPDLLVEPDTPVTLGGLEFTVTDLGPGESPVDTLWLLAGQAVFAGDIAYNEMHAYLADGLHAQWLESLRRLEHKLDDQATLYVGHGAPGGLDLLATQRAYIEAFVSAVADAAELDQSARHAVVSKRMREQLPDERLQFLMELSIEPVLAGLDR
jgi:glyoxylase-like metal-dependent hydrolase (beta-lactamase superfamily II)